MYPESTAGYLAKNSVAYFGIEYKNFIMGPPSIFNSESVLFGGDVELELFTDVWRS
jgi:hypothetical protein